ncbi:MAG TPA: MerR family transcriptional regulator [Terriglobales bacterium]|nr:MerR family transcriptional regulator [Terriglobales bacterium]
MRAAALAIPDKLYFKIGEVARLAGVEPYVLRFWESEFPALKPGKSSKGQRLYRRRELDLALQIKSLLHEQGFTIAGARQKLKQEHQGKKAQTALPLSGGRDRELLLRVRAEIEELTSLLARKN